MHEFIEQLAKAEGFQRVYFLPLKQLREWRVRATRAHFGESLPDDLTAAFPRAGCIALLVYPYAPFCAKERIPAYYVNSNRSYHAAKALAHALNASGIGCEYASLPYRALAFSCGIGDIGQNGLLHISPYGSRIVLQALAVEGCAPLSYAEHESGCPQGCMLCSLACPTGAILEQGVQIERCMRAHMEGAATSDELKPLLHCHLGCERCMDACPFNAGLACSAPDETMREAFNLKRLITGDAASARALVGRNFTSQGRLTAEAIVFAAREGLYEAEIRAALNSPFEAVRDAAQWALSNCFSAPAHPNA